MRGAEGIASTAESLEGAARRAQITHTPYRAWCRHCVRARGRNAPHRTRTEEQRERQVPKVGMDYFFMSQADEKADKNPLIVMVDESTGERYATAVGKKGIGEENEMEWLVKDMSEEMKSWGHQGGDGGHIILQSDGERSIVALRTTLAKFHGEKVVPEDPPRGESQSRRTRGGVAGNAPQQRERASESPTL